MINLFNDYSKTSSKAKYRSIYGEKLKILTPKQMFQRLPAALGQVKSGNISQNLINGIRQNINFFHWVK